MIILTITESTNQLFSGIPEYIEFSSNIPVTIFYTFDGTEPTEDDDIAVGKVYLPTTGIIITLKALAVGSNSEQVIIEQEWSTVQEDLDRSRLLKKEGINVLPYGKAAVESIAYDSEGDPAKSSVIEYSELEIKTSKTNRIGEPIPDNSTHEFIRFQSRKIPSTTDIVSSINNNVSFNPKAKVIIIDGSSQQKLDEQTYRVLNRNHDSIPLTSKLTPGHEQYQLVSGNMVKYIYNPKTGKIVFYHYESRENRWIMSTQQIEPKKLNITPRYDRGGSFVFRWIDNRTNSQVF